MPRRFVPSPPASLGLPDAYRLIGGPECWPGMGLPLFIELLCLELGAFWCVRACVGAQVYAHAHVGYMCVHDCMHTCAHMRVHGCMCVHMCVHT